MTSTTASVYVDSSTVEKLRELLDEVVKQQQEHMSASPAPVGGNLGRGFGDFAGELDRHLTALHQATAYRLEAIRAATVAALEQIDLMVAEDEAFGDQLKGRLQ
ncbi:MULTISPECIES: hypothetical protein [unclassified Corynebacterium]|uniref:hypothetical protein n=1 Tax=unclassified Corynebacterium TaxID=2624378 RepID=UPI0035245FA2